MSADILPFSGQWQGRTDPALEETNFETAAQQSAIREARLIVNAKRATDDWTAHLLVAWLATLDRKDRMKLEFALSGPNATDSEDAQQALALVKFANSGKEYRERITAAMDAILAREAGQ